jgi:tetrahydromethanopterin S-methyltransferase subunit F
MVEQEVSLVKMNSELYREAAELVEANQIDYPSIKNFVEVAVRNQINLIKYDIENREALISPNGKLKAGHKREFTNCLACGSVFLNEKEKSKKGKKLCLRCTKIIKNLNKFVD